MDAESKVKLARDGIPVTQNCAYLDTGSVGAVSSVYGDVLSRCTAEDQQIGRAQATRFEKIDDAKSKIRSELGAILGAGANEFELTQGTADAVQTLLERIDWADGDEILTTQIEFPRCRGKIDALQRDHGVTVRVAEVPADDANELRWLDQAISRRTRLIAFSAVAFATGQKLPLTEIAELARARNILTLVDGAQFVGSGSLDLKHCPIDFLALPLQKWLCGPEGLGALYIRSGRLSGLRSDHVTHAWPVLEATVAHLHWMRTALGWDWIHERISRLSAYARDKAAGLAVPALVTPAEHAGLIAVRCAPGTSQQLMDRLAGRQIIVRHRPELELLRISTAFFSTEEEIDSFIGTIS